MFLTAVAALGCAILLLDAASGRDDLLPRRGAGLHAPYGHGMADVTVRQQLRRTLARADQPRGEQRLRRHLTEIRQLVEPHELRLLAERIREPALRHPARERHLAAFESWLAAARTMMPGARLDALVSLAGRLARAGARAAAEPLAVPVRAGCRHQVVKSELPAADLRGVVSTLCHFLFLRRRDGDQVPDALDHAAQRRRILLDDHILMVLEAERL